MTILERDLILSFSNQHRLCRTEEKARATPGDFDAYFFVGGFSG